MLSFAVDRSKCVKCGKCVEACCNSRVLETDASGYPFYENVHKCVSCGHCLAICPENAISLLPLKGAESSAYATATREYSPSKIEPSALAPFLAGIRSNRFFSEKPVSQEDIKAILEAMACSPSAGNEQNRSYYVFSTREQIRELEKDMQACQLSRSKIFKNPLNRKIMTGFMMKHARSVYAEKGLPFPKDGMERAIANDIDDIARPRPDFFYHKAACAILAASNTRKKGMHKDFYRSDVAISLTHGIIFAQSLGISSCRLGVSEIFFNSDAKLKAKYGIPKEERVDGIVGFGYSTVAWARIPPRGPVKVVWK
jgi:nitroreductase/NAD-dependent dihydropyrimidine dehydrogenase PreA subunit